MAEFHSVMERAVQANGLNQKALPIRYRLRKHFFQEEYRNFSLLEKISPLTLPTALPCLFYPGCGADILSPLIYIEKLFPDISPWEFFFVDVEDTFGLIKTILDDVGISFHEDHQRLQFYWKKTLVSLCFKQQNVSSMPKPEFHLYFERAFGIFKSEIPFYEQNIVAALAPGGVVISDSGFHNCALERIPVPPQLSLYGEMVIGIKE